MSAPFAHQTLGELVRECIGRSRVLERYGIDYCCGGHRSLAKACDDRGVDLEEVCRELDEADRLPPPDETNWSTAPLIALTKHIVRRHHTYLRSELPRLRDLIARVVAAHGQREPHLARLQQVFAALENELVLHMAKEEQVLFPIVERMEEFVARGEPLHRFHCGSVNNPIAVMEDEHADAGRALAEMRALTDGYVPPKEACATYRALLAGLAELEADLHLHIHKENNILFPRSARLEAQQKNQLEPLASSPG